MVKANLTFAQYIVLAEEMYDSTVNDNAEDFPWVAVDAYPPVVIGVTFVNWDDQSLVPNIGEYARAEDDVKEFNLSRIGDARIPLGHLAIQINSLNHTCKILN